MNITNEIELYQLLADARRKKGLTQTQLARQADCRQSAVSMMERGRPDALSWAKIETIGGILELDLSEYAPKSTETESAAVSLTAKGYCPHFDCPSNTPYVVNSRLFAMPRTLSTGKFCQYCGELLEKECPECGAKISDASACCQDCGNIYIATPGDMAERAVSWAEQQRAMLRDIGVIPYPSGQLF